MLEDKRKIKKIWGSIKARGLKVFQVRSISFDDFYEWYLAQEKCCYYCGLEESQLYVLPVGKNFKKRFSIDRKDNRLSYVRGNICLCCFLCNWLKGNFFTEEDMKIIGRQIIRPKLQKMILTGRSNILKDQEEFLLGQIKNEMDQRKRWADYQSGAPGLIALDHITMRNIYTNDHGGLA